MIWVVCILLLSAVDGSILEEVHGRTLMTLEECNKSIEGKIEPVKDGVAVEYRCHKVEGVET